MYQRNNITTHATLIDAVNKVLLNKQHLYILLSLSKLTQYKTTCNQLTLTFNSLYNRLSNVTRCF